MIVATVRYAVILYTDITSLTCWTRNAMFFFRIRSILTTHESFVIFYLILKQNMKVLKGTINLIETSPIDQYGIPNIAKFLVDLLGMNLFHKPKHNLHLFLDHLQWTMPAESYYRYFILKSFIEIVNWHFTYSYWRIIPKLPFIPICLLIIICVSWAIRKIPIISQHMILFWIS